MKPGTLKRLVSDSSMSMMKAFVYPYRIFLALAVLALSDLGELDQAAFAASAKSKKEAQQTVTQAAVSDQKATERYSKSSAKKVLKHVAEKSVTPEPQSKKPSDQPVRKTRRHGKTSKKLKPPATIQPKPDLSYHGILEQPQRYDPSREHRKGGAPNPQAGELLHDHFQELDKNRDGMIDPFERAFGRLDIDRDLTNRQWE